jgi:hypothetical protein
LKLYGRDNLACKTQKPVNFPLQATGYQTEIYNRLKQRGIKPLSVAGELNCSYPPAIVGSLHLQISFIQLLST